MDTPLARWFVSSPRPLLLAALGHVIVAVSMLVPIPPAGVVVAETHLDKLVHGACWGALAFTTWWCWSRARWVRTVVAGGIFGVLVELAQGLTVTRSADPWDALADLAGAVLGASAAHLYQRSQRPKPGVTP